MTLTQVITVVVQPLEQMYFSMAGLTCVWAVSASTFPPSSRCCWPAAVGRLLFCPLVYIANTSTLLCISYCAVPATEYGDCCLTLSLIILIHSFNRLPTDLIDDIICVLWVALHGCFGLIRFLSYFGLA